VAVVSVACAVVALVKVGGPVNLVQDFPVDFVMGPNMNYGLLLVGTFVFFLAKQLITIMNMHDSFRFLNAKDSKNARKAALLAMGLMAVGSVIWFIPPWASAILYPDAANAYPELGSKAADAVYLVFARNAMPVGTVGLLLAGLFAATMSSMDSALNKNSGIFVRSLYQPYLTPGWAPWVTVLLGLGVSAFVKYVFTPQVFADLIGLDPFTKREATDMGLILTIGGQVFITGGFFCLTSLFYQERADKYVAQRQHFFEDLETPVIADFEQDSYDQQQRNKLGAIVSFMGLGLLVMTLIPNPMWGRLTFLACAAALFLIGFLLRKSAKSNFRTPATATK